jgi:hypothetical protein
MKNRKMYLPNYYNGSIVNLMSSIALASGLKTSILPLKNLPVEKLKKAKNIILLVIDGLGYEYIRKKRKKTILNDYMQGSMTSVFPATTAAAVTSYLTGSYPGEHANTGWYVYLKQLGTDVCLLPFVTRIRGVPLNIFGIKISDILKEKAFSSKLKIKNYIIQPDELAYSDYSRLMSKNSSIVGYKNLNGLLNSIKKSINSTNSKKYIYAYWPEVDRLNHFFGVNSRESEKHFRELDLKLGKFIKYIEKTDSILIISSDHGFVNTPKEKIIRLENHPKLKECLYAPLSGEPRVVYCYVYPKKRKYFERYIKTKFKKYCWIFKSRELVKKNFFGFGKINPQLYERIGDYTLIMKDDYIFKDRVFGEEGKNVKKGYHGGVSKEEMFVPLVVAFGKKKQKSF